MNYISEDKGLQSKTYPAKYDPERGGLAFRKPLTWQRGAGFQRMRHRPKENFLGLKAEGSGCQAEINRSSL